jgi:hypothetical protein
MDYNCVNPILLLGFNRPEKTEKIIAEIKSVRPKKLFVSIDGARSDSDIRKVKAL